MEAKKWPQTLSTTGIFQTIYSHQNWSKLKCFRVDQCLLSFVNFMRLFGFLLTRGNVRLADKSKKLNSICDHKCMRMCLCSSVIGARVLFSWRKWCLNTRNTFAMDEFNVEFTQFAFDFIPESNAIFKGFDTFEEFQWSIVTWTVMRRHTKTVLSFFVYKKHTHEVKNNENSVCVNKTACGQTKILSIEKFSVFFLLPLSFPHSPFGSVVVVNDVASLRWPLGNGEIIVLLLVIRFDDDEPKYIYFPCFRMFVCVCVCVC